MNRAILCIFAKPPVAGEVKTRLIPYVSATEAARLAQAFLEDVAAACRKVAQTQTVIATVGQWPSQITRPDSLSLWEQGEGDLGARIETILLRALELAPAAIAIGADVPLISQEILENAVVQLETSDAVIGPSEDGGFYLLGVTRMQRGLLKELPWSCAQTAQATGQRLIENGYRVVNTSELFDVDTPQDLQRLTELPVAGATGRLWQELRGPA